MTAKKYTEIKEKPKITWIGVIIWIAIYTSIFLMGTLGGIILQQQITKQTVIDVLQYTEIDLDVNFNETKFVEEFNKTIATPMKRDLLNQTNLTT